MLFKLLDFICISSYSNKIISHENILCSNEFFLHPKTISFGIKSINHASKQFKRGFASLHKKNLHNPFFLSISFDTRARNPLNM